MSKIIQNLQVPIDQALEDRLQWMMPEHGPYRVLRQSVDARQRHNPHFVYSIEIAEKGETLPEIRFDLEKLSQAPQEKPLIIGSGPAGLFAALRFVERGIPCILFERGSESEERMKSINRFWRYGEMDTRNNVCYGEGGAGLYSDGKLITRIKSPHIPYVLNRLVQFGAPDEIQYLSNPHVGSDRIRRVIPKMREYLLSHGCEIRFNTQVTEILFSESNSGKPKVVGVKTEHGDEFKSPFVVLATGHSAEDMLHHLHSKNVYLEGKSFAMGLRVEHSQKAINKIQYRDFAEHPKLGAANYKLAHHNYRTQIGVYSFCMCPGGYVLSCGTEADALVCNGMSNYKRNSAYANSAIVVSIPHDELFGKDLFGGLKMRRDLEQKAFQAVQKAGGTKELPVQNLVGFVEGKQGTTFQGSSPSGKKDLRLDTLLPDFMTERLREGFTEFDKSMKGFLTADAQVYGIESRTSCPVRITRDDETFESVSHLGLYPVGEGAGYAGGITSAACDGIRVAEKIFENLQSLNAVKS